MNFARLNHILIPKTLEGRERMRKRPMIRLLRPVTWFYSALSDEGRVLSLLVLFVGTASLEVSRTQVYILWAILFGLMVGSLLLRRTYRLEGVSLETRAPERIAVGAEMTFQLYLRNRHDKSYQALRVRGPFLPWDGSFKAPPPRAGELAADSVWTTQIRARFIERGPHHIEPFTACAALPMGIAVGPSVASRGCRFTVVPRIAPVQSFPIEHGESRHRGGSRQSLLRGDATEIRGVRPYRIGDSLRDLHPKTWARLGIPHVREYQQETFSRIAIIVDNDVSESTENGFEAVLSLTAGIIDKLVHTEALVDALIIGDAITRFSRGSAQATVDRSLDALAHAQRGQAQPLEELIEQLTPIFASTSSVIIVTQSTDVSRLQLVDELRARRVAARMLRVHDDTGPAWLAQRRTVTPPRSDAEHMVLASQINGEEAIPL